jgi:hypothetical protein
MRQVGAVDLSALVRTALTPVAPVPDIVTFAEDPSFLGDGGPGLHPRQRTLLRLIYLETEMMTSYDREVIDSWASNFYLGPDRFGTVLDIWDRVRWLRAHGRDHFSHVILIGVAEAGRVSRRGTTSSRTCSRVVRSPGFASFLASARRNHIS